jgi:hypothetical protein
MSRTYMLLGVSRAQFCIVRGVTGGDEQNHLPIHF